MKKSKKVNCYLCGEIDPNDQHYDPKKHGICMIHSVSLWELAKGGLSFEMRDSIVHLRLDRSASHSVKRKPKKWQAAEFNLVLSTGYEVCLNTSDLQKGIEHLARAILGETFLPIANRNTAKGADIAYKRAIEAAKAEIDFLTSKIDPPMATTLMRAVMWSGILKEIERLERRDLEKN